MCNECGRVFQTQDPNKPRFAIAICSCGASLAPPGDPAARIGDWLGDRGVAALVVGDADIGSSAARRAVEAATAAPDVRGRMDACHDTSDWSARPICYICFRRIVSDMNGRILNYHKPPTDN